jgi:potassium-transporting ATPase KdpC subunit
MPMLIASVRLVVATMLVCVVGYVAVILGIAGLFSDTARGSLIEAVNGRIVGSRLIAQGFAQPRYFWPRPSAAGKNGYDATSGSGSNKSPTSDDLKKRAQEVVARYGATAAKPLPPELAAASGSGLDPHISVEAARYQAARVAQARGKSVAEIETLIGAHTVTVGGLLASVPVVNVLELNLALDKAQK